MKTFGRAGGSSAVSAAAYRSGERLRDERSGQTFDHSERRDVLHKEILLPAEFAADPPEWTRERGTFWNETERAEARKTPVWRENSWWRCPTNLICRSSCN